MRRPDGWKEELQTFLEKMPLAQSTEGKVFGMNCFEAGADAMLEALKKEGDYSHIGYWNTPIMESGGGWLVFIPDKETRFWPKNGVGQQQVSV